MENRYSDLEEKLSKFIAVLGGEDNPGESAVDGANQAHVELIDFDQLLTILDETISVLRDACRRENDYAVVRSWLVNRITSLSRGRQAFASRSDSSGNAGSMETATIPELLRRFEDESAMLRETAGPTGSQVDGVSSYRRKEFALYKS